MPPAAWCLQACVYWPGLQNSTKFMEQPAHTIAKTRPCCPAHRPGGVAGLLGMDDNADMVNFGAAIIADLGWLMHTLQT